MKQALLSTFLFFTFHLSLFTKVNAQQDAQYSMYRFNGLYINPAYAGSHDVITASAIYRNQWVKMPGAPQSASAAVHAPLTNNRIGLGVIYTYDQIGVMKNNSVSASFAYRIPIGKKKITKLCIGLSAGFTNYRADLNSVATTDADDPNFAGNNQNRWLPNVGFGIYLYSPKFFVGISLPHMLANRLTGKSSVFETSPDIAKQYYHLLVTGGYVFDLGKKVKFMPSVLMKYVPVHSPVTFDFNATFIFVDRLWIGAAYRLNDSYNFMAAVNITKQLKVGYAYDLTVSPLRGYTNGSHEVMLSFDFDFKASGKKVISPRHVKYF
ncbi:MAG: type IX secretion system membrane protein PorP/SprF [Chitinophagales bacterium]|nr:type IX secretion system membrane protein PorP/SprF [Chitinophagales bacterium]